LAKPIQLSFLFFYCAVICEKAGIQISEVRFFNESFHQSPIRSLHFYFRGLTRIILREGSIDDRLKSAIERDGVSVQFVTSEADVSTETIPVGNPWSKFIESQPIPPTIQIICGTLGQTVSTDFLRQSCGLFRNNPILLRQQSYRVQARVSREAFQLFLDAIEQRKIEITPQCRAHVTMLAEEFDFVSLRAQLATAEAPLDTRLPIDAFIADFLHCAWNSLPTIGTFYIDAAVFSLSVALHGPDSPLEAFERFSHYAGDDRTGNVLIGRDEITRGLAEVFGPALMSRPESITVGALGGCVVAIGLHGTVWGAAQWIAFDRAMVAAFIANEGRFQITNDHFYLRELPT
jgi:hypothetical protein